MELCPYCFKPLPDNGVCNCHYEESENARIEEALRPGAIVGACYQIGAVLGKGGFGITYRGYDLNMQKVVAIKEFYPNGLVVRNGMINKSDFLRTGVYKYVRPVTGNKREIFQKNLDLFYREAIALGKLSKLPNVVSAYHVFRENGTAYIVMEFVEGVSLKQLIREKGRLSASELIPLLDPILAALEQVHKEGILHRDISPDNIMIENGQPVLVDFGAARVSEETQSSMIIGKRGYSSFEQMTGGFQDARSDIYSLGATYYRALSGREPDDVLDRFNSDEVVPLKKLIPGISRAVSDAVMKAMALKPDDRWNSVAEFRMALKGMKITDSSAKSGERSGFLPVLSKMKFLLLFILAAILFGGGYFVYKYFAGKNISHEPEETLVAENDQAENTELFVTEITQIDSVETVEQDIVQVEVTEIEETEIVQIEVTEPFDEISVVLTDMVNTKAAISITQTKIAVPVASDTPQIITVQVMTPTIEPSATATPFPTATPVPLTPTTPAWIYETNPVLNGSISAKNANKRGADYLNANNYDEAVRWFYFAAKAGDQNAQRNLGNCYYYGRGVTKDYAEAVKWYKLSADQGNTLSQYYLGLRYFRGEGVEQDYEEAIKWFEEAAVKGNVGAQYMTGKCYAEGYGVRKNENTAVTWYRTAAENGNSDAQFALGEAYEIGFVNLSKDITQAAHWYRRSSEKGKTEAEERLLDIQNTVLSNDVIVKTSPLKDGLVIRSAMKGEKVKLLGENRLVDGVSWTKIQLQDGYEGWVYSSAFSSK